MSATALLSRTRKIARISAAASELWWPLTPWIRYRGQGALLQIENTSYCNFKCRYCVTHSPNSLVPLRRGHMSMDTYRAIIERHPEARIVVLQGDGEPLMDPTLFDKIAYARARGLATQVISNGSLLVAKESSSVPSMIDRLLQHGPDLFLVSIDAVSPQRNEHNRTGLNYRAVTAAVAQLNAKPKSRRMIVGLLSVVHGEFSDESADALRDFDRLNIDVLFYKQLNRAFVGRIKDYQGGNASAVPRQLQRQLSYPISHQRLSNIAPCPQLKFALPYYLWDGQRTACCILNSERYAKPEFSRESLLSGWRKKAMPSECEQCSYFAGYPT
jgi:sulfatase maturation enzyme AslB (radical SAM superfamily)